MPLPLIASLLLPGIGMAARGAGAIASGVGRASAVSAGGNPYAPSPDQKAPTGKGKKVMDAMLGLPKTMKSVAGKGLGIAGVSLSVSSLLRQSQLFTGTIGALFQVVGGFVDVILAPFMPYFAKMIGKLGTYIPVVQEYAIKVHDWLAKNVFPFLSKVAGEYGKLIKFSWDFLKTTFWPIVEAMMLYIKMIFVRVYIPLAKKIIDFVKWLFEPLTRGFKGFEWLMGYVPQALEYFTAFLDNILSFQWLKTAVSKVLGFFANLVNSLATLKIPTMGSPFSKLAGLGDKLEATIASMNSPSSKASRGGQQINISVSTNVNGVPNLNDSQSNFDLSNKESINQAKRTEVNLDSNSFSPIYIE